MNAATIKKRISELCTLFAFDYNGRSYGVDPYSKESFSLFVADGGAEKTVSSIDDVMNEPFFDGKSLSEIAEEITITEW